MSDDTRPRKYYEISEKGKRELILEKEQWVQVNFVLSKIWEIESSVN
jgi:DNA-binding PadR family transcriptional regulator